MTGRTLVLVDKTRLATLRDIHNQAVKAYDDDAYVRNLLAVQIAVIDEILTALCAGQDQPEHKETDE